MQKVLSHIGRKRLCPLIAGIGALKYVDLPNLEIECFAISLINSSERCLFVRSSKFERASERTVHRRVGLSMSLVQQAGKSTFQYSKQLI